MIWFPIPTDYRSGVMATESRYEERHTDDWWDDGTNATESQAGFTESYHGETDADGVINAEYGYTATKRYTFGKYDSDDNYTTGSTTVSEAGGYTIGGQVAEGQATGSIDSTSTAEAYGTYKEHYNDGSGWTVPYSFTDSSEEHLTDTQDLGWVGEVNRPVDELVRATVGGTTTCVQSFTVYALNSDDDFTTEWTSAAGTCATTLEGYNWDRHNATQAVDPYPPDALLDQYAVPEFCHKLRVADMGFVGVIPDTYLALVNAYTVTGQYSHTEEVENFDTYVEVSRSDETFNRYHYTELEAQTIQRWDYRIAPTIGFNRRLSPYPKVKTIGLRAGFQIWSEYGEGERIGTNYNIDVASTVTDLVELALREQGTTYQGPWGVTLVSVLHSNDTLALDGDVMPRTETVFGHGHGLGPVSVTWSRGVLDVTLIEGTDTTYIQVSITDASLTQTFAKGVALAIEPLYYLETELGDGGPAVYEYPCIDTAHAEVYFPEPSPL